MGKADATRDVTIPPNSVIALDFDGVLCDSAVETGLTAWRAGRQVWPEWRTPAPPGPVLERFLGLRPLLETGYQSIPLMRLAWEGAGLDDLKDCFASKADETTARAGRQRQDMLELFGTTRDRWIATDLDGWLAAHRFYPRVVAAVDRLQRRHRILVISTKQERFLLQLLRGTPLTLPRDHVFGLETGKSKATILGEVLASADGSYGVAFVEDRLDTLVDVAAQPALRPVTLFLAAWGYNTPAERAQAQASDRIALLDLPDLDTWQ